MTKAKQSFNNLKKALAALEKSLASPPIEDRDFAGIIQCFEFTYELTWKTLKLVLEVNGVEVSFPRVVFEAAYKNKMIDGNEIWKTIMEARNQTVHTYDQALAVALCKEIQESYLPTFQKTISKLEPFIS